MDAFLGGSNKVKIKHLLNVEKMDAEWSQEDQLIGTFQFYAC